MIRTVQLRSFSIQLTTQSIEFFSANRVFVPSLQASVLWLCGVGHVQVDSYGTAHGFDYLDYYYNERFGVPGTAYFHTMLRTFYSMGYVEGSSLIGIPYDWRLPPWQASIAPLCTKAALTMHAMLADIQQNNVYSGATLREKSAWRPQSQVC